MKHKRTKSAQIVHLPNGKWCIEVNGQRSKPAMYSERIIDSVGSKYYVGQTAYWGNPGIWLISTMVDWEVIDES